MKSFGDQSFSFSLNGKVQKLAKGLKLIYSWSDPEGKILFPEPSIPKRVHGLWEHTCFEAFWGLKGRKEYWEANFSPSGEWNLFYFDDYRKGMREAVLASGPMMHLSHSSLEVVLPEISGAEELSLTAVVEQKDHSVSYWAWKHAQEKADFHARETFITQTF